MTSPVPLTPYETAQELLLLRKQLKDRSESENKTLLLANLVCKISIALAERGALQTMLNTCCETLVQELEASFARVWTLETDANVLELQASAGRYTHIDGPHSRVRVGTFKIGRIASNRTPHLNNDVQNDAEVSDQAWARREGMVAFAGHPLLIGDKLVGVLAVFSTARFDETTLRTLATVASLIAHGVDREWLWEKTRGALRASERSNDALQRFAAVASHDLQEPLRQVTAFSQMLTRFHREKLDAEAQEYLSFIVDGATRMGRLIKGLLAYAQIEAMNSTTLGEADTELALTDALQGLHLLTEESRAVITREPLPLLHGNPALLTQVFQNLINNAVKYRSTEDPRIHVSALRSGSEWIFSVSDNGVGIAPQYRTQIFGVFTRLHGKDIEGAGLGLAFCSKIIELHHGRIWVEENSSARTGSVFRFAIPVLD